jgi:hypothetical protein
LSRYDVGLARESSKKMITRIILSLGTLALLIANSRRFYIRMTDVNPYGTYWYLAHAIFQVVLWWILCLIIVWKMFPIEKRVNKH